MTLVIIGDDVERTLPVAALASVTSGERVLFTSDQDIGEITVPVEGCGVAGTAVIASVSPDDPVEGQSFVIAAATVRLKSIFEARAHELAAKPVLLAPGGFAAVLVSAETFRLWDAPVPRFSEVPGWIAGGHLEGGRVRLTMRKRNVSFAGSSDSETASALEHFSRYFLDLVPSDLVSTSLANGNAVIHPPLAILNATRIENGEKWHYWDEGFTPAVQHLMAAVDSERLALVQALHGEGISVLDAALAAYGDDGMRGQSFYEAVKLFGPYRGRLGPSELDGRFLTDDVPFGIAAYEQLAARVGVEHSAMTAVRVLSEIILGRELKADANAVEALAAYAQDRYALTATAGIRNI